MRVCLNKIFGRNLKASLSGFTLIELVITVAVFVMLATAAISAFNVLAKTVKAAREKAIISSLASQYMEVVRNMPYAQVGTLTGNPHGNLPDCPASQQPACPNAISTNIQGVSYKILYEVAYIDDASDGTATTTPADSVPADYKQVKMSILNTYTKQTTYFLTNIVPQGAEGSNNSGTLLVKVINSQGQPVPDANIHIQSPPTNPTIILDRDSNANGFWEEDGLPTGVNMYRIVASKPGYSTDQTYPITAQNPNPINPDATIAAGKVTSVTLIIDLLSNLTINTQDRFCRALSGIDLNVSGAKLIGTSPNVPKFSQNFTSNSNGQVLLNNIEWDTYTPVLLTGQNYTIFGTSPIQKITVLPGTSQTFTMILGPYASNSLLVIVKDASTQAPLEGAYVDFQKGGSQPQEYTGYTGGSVWLQNDWSGGGGVANWSTSTQDTYYQTTGNIYINNGSNDVELAKVGNRYVTNATSTLESSTFDTGTSASSYTTITWEPASQDPSTTMAIQVASNNDNSTWNYVGPDGTENTYYTVSGSDISSVHNNKRYIRYKVYMSTGDGRKTPVLSEVQFNYVSGCFTPGQIMFNDITPSNGSPYTLTVNLDGYQTQVVNGVQITGNQSITVLMSH